MIKDKNATIGYHCPQCGISILNTVSLFSFSTPGNLIKLKCPCGASELAVNITREKKFRLTIPCIVCPNSHSYMISPHIFFDRDIFAFSCKFTALDICFTGKSALVMDAMKKNEQELLETFAEYDDSFDPEMSEFSDIFSWDEDDFEGDEDWFDELFGGLDDVGDDDYLDIYELLGMGKKPGFELHKNEDFDPEQDGGIDLKLYSGFSTYRAGVPERPKKPLEMELDSSIDVSKIKVKSYSVVMQVLGELSRLVRDKKIYCKCGRFDGSVSLLDDCLRVSCKICGAEREIKSAGTADVQYISEIGELFLDFED